VQLELRGQSCKLGVLQADIDLMMPKRLPQTDDMTPTEAAEMVLMIRRLKAAWWVLLGGQLVWKRRLSDALELYFIFCSQLPASRWMGYGISVQLCSGYEIQSRFKNDAVHN